MKIRSLLLGSVAAAGLSTGAFAADLGVLTSLDVCDALGLSGLTISSDTNCLQITGEVKYNFNWGDYTDNGDSAVFVDTEADGGLDLLPVGNGYNDWSSKFSAWIKFVATADSDFGPAKAVLKLKQKDYKLVTDAGYSGSSAYDTSTGSSSGGVYMDEAYVSIGDSTVIMAGKKGSIMKKGDDEPLNWLGLFNSEDVDSGVSWGPDVSIGDGGHVIQITSDLGNGVSVGAGLENLDGSTASEAGTAVGYIAYAGEGISAHVTVAAAGVLDGTVEDWGVHAGFAGTFDNFKVVLAGAYGHDDVMSRDYWNVLASASATFDMFTIAASFEAVQNDGNDTDYGAGASIAATVSDGVTLNLGGRWYHEGTSGDDSYQIAASVAAAVTESITLTGEIGYLNNDDGEDAMYGSAKLAWAPGGGYTSSVKGTVSSANWGDLGYKIETEFKKTFE
ncbi:MAG: hypothetical protein J0I99_18520 [Devosia sp.]|uniref:hypothetical protein n=1 Tax=Devosia sp. TaxID=1871048 RepID=UPI001AC684D1|nr:hypothetical protein [Devosia sp.]MBN9317739.1 hypothetical protein [Devosia sp.]